MPVYYALPDASDPNGFQLASSQTAYLAGQSVALDPDPQLISTTVNGRALDLLNSDPTTESVLVDPGSVVSSDGSLSATIASVNTSTNEIVFDEDDAAPQLASGQAVVYHQGQAASIANLVNGQDLLCHPRPQ